MKKIILFILLLTVVAYTQPIDTTHTNDGIVSLPDSVLFSTDSTAQRTFSDAKYQSKIVINIKDFGAVGDGITDDGAAIQATLNYVSGLGGGTVYIPEGTYITSQTLLPASGVNILGAGNGTIISYTGSTRLIYLDATATFIDNMEIKNLYLDCNDAIGIELETAGIYAITLLNVSNLKILNCSYGIYLSSLTSNSYKVKFDNIRIQFISIAGIKTNGGAYNSFTQMDIANVSDGAYSIWDAGLGSSFSNISTDGCIKEDGILNVWENIAIELINADTPPQSSVISVNGGSNAFYSIRIINVDGTKCETGMNFLSINNTLTDLSIINTSFTAPVYPVGLSAGSSGRILGSSRQTGYNIEQYVSATTLANWTITDCNFATMDYISNTIAKIVSPNINSSSITNSNINMSTLPLYLTGNDTSKGSWRIKGLLGGSFIIEMDTADGNNWVTMSGATPDLYTETNSYISRVIADGGSIVDTFYLNDAIGYSKATGIYDSTYIWCDANFGVKKDANNKVTKLYDLFGHDLVQTDTSKSPTLTLNYRNGLATLDFDSLRTMAYTFTAGEGLAQPNIITIMLANKDSNALDTYLTTYPNSIQTLLNVTAGGRFAITATNGYVYNSSDVALLTDHIYTGIYNGISSMTYLDGVYGGETGQIGADAFGEEGDILYLNGLSETMNTGNTYITSFIVHNKLTGRELPEIFLSKVAKYDANGGGLSEAEVASMIQDSLNAGYESSFTGEEIDKAIGNTLYSVIKTNPDSATTFTLLRTKAEIVIDSVFALVQGTSALVDFNLAYGTNRTSGTNVFSSSQSADNVTVGETFTTFSSATIPVNNMIWLNITNTDNTPEEFLCVIYYH